MLVKGGCYMANVLIAGESWISSTVEYKGYDSFASTKLENGCSHRVKELEARGHSVTHLFAHDVPEQFPWSEDDMAEYDVIILSDIGANSILLSERVFDQGKPTVNRLEVLKHWVLNGGALMMAGGYLSFAGFEGKAHYHGTPVEEVLPVNILPYDDRREVPQGLTPQVTKESLITENLGCFPQVLGYQVATPKESSDILLKVAGDPLLVTASFGKGKSLAYMSDIGPHWASNEFMNWQNYGEFFSRCINWLSNN